MRTGFDHDLYTRMQSDNIRSRIAAFGGKLYLELGGKLLITADHGNAEHMRNEDGSPNTAHTTNLVDLIYVADDKDQVTLSDGILADVAPTLLSLMGLKQPAEMSGHSLVTPGK